MSRRDGPVSRRATVPATALMLALVIVAVPFLATGAGDAEAGRQSSVPVEWLSFREGKAAARHQERPLLVFFSAARNTESARLDREAWTDRRVRAYLGDHLVAARVDMMDIPSLAEQYGIGEAPAILLLTPQGRPLVVLRGFHGPDSILRVATYAVTRAWEFADYATWLSRQQIR